MEILRLSPAEWQAFSHDAHKVVFKELNRPELERIDFALIAGEAGLPRGYMTCREWDGETLYWQFGGALPGTRDTVHTFRAYSAFADYARVHYKRVVTLIENTNIVMLKMAFKVGFRIIGVRTFKGSVLAELLLEFGEPNAS